MNPAIRLEEATKYYGKTQGLDRLTLKAWEGEIFGFLGPNGSGKTTAINLMLDLVRPTSGRLSILGLDTHKNGLRIRANCGYIPGEPGFYGDMTGRDYLNFFAGLKKKDCKKRIGYLSDIFFQIRLESRIRAYSHGMKQILSIIQAFMGDPAVYILDEPATNLDPIMRKSFQELLVGEKKRGKTIFLSSHVLSDMERICDRVCIIRQGRKVLLETMDDLRKKLRKRVTIMFDREMEPGEIMLQGVSNVKKVGKYLEFDFAGDINRFLFDVSRYSVVDFDFRYVSLEELFMDYFGPSR